MHAPEGTRRCVVDTNVWLYAFIESGDSLKREAARALVSREEIVVSLEGGVP